MGGVAQDLVIPKRRKQHSEKLILSGLVALPLEQTLKRGGRRGGGFAGGIISTVLGATWAQRAVLSLDFFVIFLVQFSKKTTKLNSLEKKIRDSAATRANAPIAQLPKNRTNKPLSYSEQFTNSFKILYICQSVSKYFLCLFIFFSLFLL